MKRTTLLAVALAVMISAGMHAAKKTPVQKVGLVSMQGYVGQRYDECLNRRVKTENLDTLISVYRHQDEESNMWGSEFWGKWVQGAIGMYHFTHDEELKGIIQQAEDRLMACQLKNGYIGDYDEQHQLGGWDVWGRKYTLLGLIKWYWETGDKNALKSATRLLDYTMTQVGPGKKSILECGAYVGMPPSSILEPTMFMYQTTGQQRYLDFAKYIAEELDRVGGPQLITRADVPVALRVPLKPGDAWYGNKNGQKAYEMMSCYVGLLELFRETGEPDLLKSAQTTWQHIVDEEINICGSGASHECWYGGRALQTRVSALTMETCVTFTWMQFCERLLEFTGDPKYVDQIERTMYNALMASMKGDGSQIVKYTPLEGYRQEGEHQCHIPINCCNANGPRAFAMIPRVMYRLPSEGRVDINLFVPSQTTIEMGGQSIALSQETDYPLHGDVHIGVSPQHEATFTVALRIPAWSRNTRVEVNGKQVEGVKAGEYCLIERAWKAGDKVTLNTDIQARLVEMNDMQAIERGPVVLARDTRFRDGYVDEACLIPTHDGNIVNLEPVPAPKGMWMAFRITMPRGAYNTEKFETRFCDFASAGNTWDKAERYRVWLPKINDPSKVR
ncbi:MAG: glycoside hydrolase family 127 protein [Bacteroidaceae bacterium]